MVVYADLVFLTNLVIDGAVLMTTAWVRGIRPRLPRLAGAAALGAAYAVMVFFPPVAFLYTLLLKIGLSLLMLWTAFGFGSLQRFVRNAAAFYGVNFVAAGGALGFHYLWQNSVWDGVWLTRTGGLGFEFRASLAFVLLAALASLLLYRSAWHGRRRADRTEAHLAEVSVTIDGRECNCIGLVDTGNQLYDPLTRTPVMVMEASLWQAELPAVWIDRIRDAQVDRLVAGLGAEDGPWRDRLRLVPYRGINRGTQFMLALKPDRVRITQNGTLFESSKVLIGLDGGKLVSDGTYQAIVHPSLLESRDAG